MRHNQRRQEHLATLGLDLTRKKVLEVGAGIGDHTSFFVDRGCDVTITEPRQENAILLKDRYPAHRVGLLDLNQPPVLNELFEVVYCYGTLYHLQDPARALEFMASVCSGMLLMETCVSYLDQGGINPVKENQAIPSQAIAGQGCRPTRRWIFEALKNHFPHVYMPLTQPWHEEFPLDWTLPEPPANTNKLNRAVFIASRAPLPFPALAESIPAFQVRC